jgi:epoxyqueuosine reductase QueG
MWRPLVDTRRRLARSVQRPVPSATSKRLSRHISQDVCPWNAKFSQELADDSPFQAREFIAGKAAVTPATDILAVDQEQFSAAFRKSPMKRAKLAGMRRNAALVLENARDGAYARAARCTCSPRLPMLAT